MGMGSQGEGSQGTGLGGGGGGLGLGLGQRRTRGRAHEVRGLRLRGTECLALGHARPFLAIPPTPRPAATNCCSLSAVPASRGRGGPQRGITWNPRPPGPHPRLSDSYLTSAAGTALVCSGGTIRSRGPHRESVSLRKSTEDQGKYMIYWRKQGFDTGLLPLFRTCPTLNTHPPIEHGTHTRACRH